MTASTAKAQYYRCLSYRDREEPLQIKTEPDGAPDYLNRVLSVMDSHLEVEGFKVYVTWKLQELPSYGDNVVAIAMADEWSQVPAFADRVLATFKPYGSRPQLEVHPFRRPSRLNTLLTAKYVGILLNYLPGGFRRGWEAIKQKIKGDQLPPILPIPLGYGNQIALPIRPVRDRSHDVFFAGSVEQGAKGAPFWSPRRWLRSPKILARERMLDAVRALADEYPAVQVLIHTNKRFVLNALEYGLTDPGEVLDAQTYSKTLMDSKICLVPRGTSPETFRFFEGLRAGCILITERLPRRWYYEGAPVVQVDDWSELGEIVPALLNDPDRMERMQKQGLEWWRAKCSEEAVGTFMAQKINTLAQRAASQRN